MGYYLRLLTPSATCVSRDVVEVNLFSDFDVDLEFEPDSDEWTSLVVSRESGDMIVHVERNPVVGDELGAEWLAALREEARDGQPESAGRWLDDYLSRVRTIYALEISNSVTDADGWAPVYALLGGMKHAVGGLVQADGEGFSNEDGYQILWQFSDRVTGPWKMAVLDANGTWVAFEMELGDRAQRADFLRGEVPPTARRL